MFTLTPKKQFEVPVQAACISPDVFEGKSVAEIEAFDITEGNRVVKLGDLFEVKKDEAEAPSITLEGDWGKVKRVGQAMTKGEIVFNGNAGMHTGEKMAGGKITINGSTGSWTGSEMKKGTIEVHGDAGDYTASPYRGHDAGVKGGVIIIDGNVGTDVGCYLKGGIIKIKGNAGRFLGYMMTDGAIYVEKGCEMRPGARMKGGKIVIGGKIDEVIPSFTIDSVKPKVKIDDTQSVQGPFYVFLGDLAEQGTGKIFVNKAVNTQMKSYEKYL